MVSGQHHIHNSILISGQSSSWYINNDEKTNNEWTEYNLEDLMARCLKITEKVSFNIASEASYVYILSGQKLIQNAKNGPFRRVLKTRSLRSNSVTRQVSLNRTKIGGKCVILSNFQTMWCQKLFSQYKVFLFIRLPNFLWNNVSFYRDIIVQTLVLLHEVDINQKKKKVFLLPCFFAWSKIRPFATTPVKYEILDDYHHRAIISQKSAFRYS